MMHPATKYHRELVVGYVHAVIVGVGPFGVYGVL
jgi:hypothetical protein